MEAEVEDTEAGRALMQYVSKGDAAWSSGTLPHLIQPEALRTGAGGEVTRWPIIEASVAPKSAVSSPLGTTTVVQLRTAGVEVENSDDLLLRSEWVMPEESNAILTAIQGIGSQLSQLSTRIEALEQQPAKQLPASGDVNLRAPTVQVFSKWDHVSLLDMLMLNMVRQSHNRVQLMAGLAAKWKPDEEYMRALVDKMGAVWAAQGVVAQQPEQLLSLRTQSPMVDAIAYQAWHDKVPYLRANEAMTSTLANYGDELVPTLLSSVVYHFFRLESRVFGLFDMFDMPSNPFDYPKITSGAVLRKGSEMTDVSQLSLGGSIFSAKTSKIGTGKVTFNAGKLLAATLFSTELVEDSGINAISAFTTEYVRSVARYLDYVLLNGDELTDTNNISHLGADPTGTALSLIHI